jgi:hypothetical protein
MMDVYVSNLRHNVTEDDLRTSLGDIAIVTNVKIYHGDAHLEKQTYAIITLMPYQKIENRSRLIQSVLVTR